MTICYDRLLMIRYEVKIWILWFGIILVIIFQVFWLPNTKKYYIYIICYIYNYTNIFSLQNVTTKPFVSLTDVFCSMVLLSKVYLKDANKKDSLKTRTRSFRKCRKTIKVSWWWALFLSFFVLLAINLLFGSIFIAKLSTLQNKGS